MIPNGMKKRLLLLLVIKVKNCIRKKIEDPVPQGYFHASQGANKFRMTKKYLILNLSYASYHAHRNPVIWKRNSSKKNP